MLTAPRKPYPTAATYGSARTIAVVCVAAGLILAGLLGLVLLPGCTPDQRDAASRDLVGASASLQQASVALVGSATTRPSPVVTMVEAAAPITVPYVELIATAIGALGVLTGVVGKTIHVAPTLNGLKQTIVEQAADTALHVQPYTPWSTVAAYWLGKLVGPSAAAPVPATVANLEVVRTAPPAAAAAPAT